MKFYSNSDSLKSIHLGDSLPISKTKAESLKRTGKSYRSFTNWANVIQVEIDKIVCDLYYYDRGNIEIRKGSDL
jgi:hypothetical protein